MRFIIRKFFFAISVIAALGVLSAANGVQAVPLDPGLMATGSLKFDTDSFAAGSATQSGTMTIKEGGVDTSVTTFDGDTATGTNPLSGTFTEQGDGLRIDAVVTTGTSVADFLFAIDLTLHFFNDSGSTIEITVTIDFFNEVSTSGDDAFATSKFLLDEDGNGNKFFSDISSFTGNLDGTVTDPSILDSFSFMLAPAASLWFSGDWEVSGDTRVSGSSASLSPNAFFLVSITDDTPTEPNGVPEPGSLLLLATGLMGLGLARRRRKRA